MSSRILLGSTLTLLALGCGAEPTILDTRHEDLLEPAARASAEPAQVAPGGSAGLVVRTIPDEDPGPPFYARVGIQFLTDGELLAIPFYRPPSCVPEDFNLLDFFDFPGPAGPGAFRCDILMTGRLLIEPDAPLGTFPRQVVMAGTGKVPVWFVDPDAFQGAAADGLVTIAELESLSPLRGVAGRYHETLHPRDGEHKIIINAEGRLMDGRGFALHVTHIDDELRSIRIGIR